MKSNVSKMLKGNDMKTETDLFIKIYAKRFESF